MLWRLLLISVFLSTGCAHTSAERMMMPVPETGTREALLPTFVPTGSPCLDSVVVNMLYSGCSSVQVAQDQQGVLFFMGCVQPQPGAQDAFSRSTFIRTLRPDMLPPESEPFCGDPTGVYAMLNVPFTEIMKNDQ